MNIAETTALQTTTQTQNWCLDSGATTNLCNDSKKFLEISSSDHGILNLANSSITEINGKGTVKFVARISEGKKSVSLTNASHVPDLRTSLLPVAKITDRGYTVIFKKNGAEILDSNGNVELSAHRRGDLYFVREIEEGACVASAYSKQKEISLKLLHKRLGHANTKDILSALHKDSVTGVLLKNSKPMPNCEICIQGKMSRTSFPKNSNRKSEILDIIHTDVCGPMRVNSLGGAKYYVEFIDDRSKWCEGKFLKSKAEVSNATKEYIALVENQQGKTVKCLQSDNGGEYSSLEFNEYLKKRGITRRLTVPYNPEQNGTAERKNRILLDTARCLLLDSKLPQSFWAEAVNTANYIRNRLPSKSLNGRTPYELWTGKVPDLSHMRTFGCRVFYLNTQKIYLIYKIFHRLKVNQARKRILRNLKMRLNYFNRMIKTFLGEMKKEFTTLQARDQASVRLEVEAGQESSEQANQVGLSNSISLGIRIGLKLPN